MTTNTLKIEDIKVGLIVKDALGNIGRITDRWTEEKFSINWTGPNRCMNPDVYTLDVDPTWLSQATDDDKVAAL